MARSISKSSGKGATGGKSFVMNPTLSSYLQVSIIKTDIL